MTWISVTDRLPADFESVLMTDGDDVIIGYCTGRSPHTWWSSMDSEWGNVSAAVTHWMPLPALPEQDTKENSL